jgi:hypothetical protein
MKKNLWLREKATTPLRKSLGRVAKLVVQNMAWLRVSGRFRPSAFHHLTKTWDAGPEVFKLERTRAARPTIVGEEQGAVVR